MSDGFASVVLVLLFMLLSLLTLFPESLPLHLDRDWSPHGLDVLRHDAVVVRALLDRQLFGEVPLLLLRLGDQALEHAIPVERALELRRAHLQIVVANRISRNANLLRVVRVAFSVSQETAE